MLKQLFLLCCCVFVFSGAFSQPGFRFFPADKVDEHVGRQWEGVGVTSDSSWSSDRELEGFSKWVEVDSLDKPQNP